MLKNTFKCVFLAALLFLSSNLSAQNHPDLKSNTQDSVSWWNDDVFYEVFVRSFYDSGLDGIGDLQGLIGKLDYLKSLGVDALWLMPIMPSPSYHGYDVTDYLNVNPQYGTLNTFHQLMDSAHAKGMKVIIDYVMNHTSNDHPWFQSSQSSVSSPYRNWYVWANTKPPYFQNSWYLDNGAYYWAYFCDCMPDLNYRDTSMQNEMLSTTGFWMDSMHVDGFRLDAIQYLVEDGDTLTGTPGTHQFITKFRKYYDAHNPQIFTVGEVWGPPDPGVATYVGDTQLTTCFAFNLAFAIIDGVKGGNPALVENEMSQVISSFPSLQYSTFLTNHDQDRIFDQLSSYMPRMKLAAAIYLTLPGVPFLYYGEEVGMSGSGADQLKRKPMQWNTSANAGFTSAAHPWEALNTNYATYNVATEQADSGSLWNWYQKLISVRHQQDALRRGTYQQLGVSNPLAYSFFRAYQNDSILAILNFGNGVMSSLTVNVQTAGIAKGTYTVTDLLNGNKTTTLTVDAAGNISGLNLNAEGVLLYKFDGLAGITSPLVSSIHFFPNPVTNEMMIQFPRNISSSLSLSVYDMQGRLISRPAFQKNNNYTIQVSLAELANGVYTIRVTNDSETSNLMVIKL